MAKSLQFRRGNSTQTAANTLASGELFINTDQNTVVVGDGLTPGGNPLATQSQLASNVATLNSSISTNVAGLVTQSQLSSNVATLNNNISSVSCNLATCFNTKISCTGGGVLSSTTLCSPTLCNSTLGGTLTIGASTGTSGQVLCSTGTGVAWGVASGGGGSYSLVRCNTVIAPSAACNLAASTGTGNFLAGNVVSCLTSGSCNIAIGSLAMYCNKCSSYNIAIGNKALKCGGATSIFFCKNVGIGYRALYTSCGNGSVAIGNNTANGGLNLNRSIFIGQDAGSSSSSVTNSIIMGWLTASNAQIINDSIALGYAAMCGSSGQFCSNIAMGKKSLGGQGSSFQCHCFNVSIMECSLLFNYKGNYNVAIGHVAAKCNCCGSGNIAIGRCALRANCNSCNVIAIGNNALYSASAPQTSIAIGYKAGNTSTSITNAIIIGPSASSQCSAQNCCGIVIGRYAATNSCVGQSILIGNCVGTGLYAGHCLSIGIGYQALKGGSFTINYRNVAIGNGALCCQTIGRYNIGIGQNAGGLITSGSCNTIIGCYTGCATLANTVVIAAGCCVRLKANTGGLYVNGTLLSGGGGGSAAYCKSNCNSVFAPAVCSSSLSTCLGVNNILMGLCAGYCTLSSGTIAIGAYAGKNQCTTSPSGKNVFIGFKASCSGCNQFGKQVIIGAYAGQINAGYSNVILGHAALSCSTSNACFVRKSVAIGNYAMAFGVPGCCGGAMDGSIAIGFKSGIFCGLSCTSPSCNVGNINIGMYTSACHNATTWQNTVIGQCAGWSLNGSQNTILGALAGGCNLCGICITGTNNTLIGYMAQPLSGICNNTITLGNASITTIRSQTTSITSLSDYRDKTYIETLPVGLEFLRQVRPVTFTWKMRDGSKVGQKEAGFIAQELETVANNSSIKDWLDGLVISNDDRSRLEATPGKMLPLIVKAIQELAAENDSLKERVSALEAVINK